MDTREAIQGADVYRYHSPFCRAEYRLTDEGVIVTEKRFTRLSRVHVPYDEFPIHSTFVTAASKWYFGISVVGGFLFLVVAITLLLRKDAEPHALIVYGALCGVGVAGHLLTRRMALVFAHGGQHLAVYVRSATDDRPRAFLDALHAQKMEFLKQRLRRRAADLPLQENLRYLVALREAGLLDEPGFLELRALVEGLQPDRGPFGFGG